MFYFSKIRGVILLLISGVRTLGILCNNWRQFHQRYKRKKIVRKSFLAAFSSYVLALAKKIIQKICT